jgi:hypothetical protein
MKPTVGGIVYYKSYGTPGGEYQSEDRAAIITRVHTDECVDLCVLNPTGMFFNTSVTRDEEGRGGTWDWMPYQKGQAQKTEELEKQLEELNK